MADQGSVTTKDIYEQQYAHFGRMNDVIYKMPPIFATVLGGLWYFAASYLDKDRKVAAVVFAFSAAAFLGFIVALHRFRLAFNAYIDNINELDGKYRVTIKEARGPSTVGAMIMLLIAGLFVSVLGVLYALRAI